MNRAGEGRGVITPTFIIPLERVSSNEHALSEALLPQHVPAVVSFD